MTGVDFFFYSDQRDITLKMYIGVVGENLSAKVIQPFVCTWASPSENSNSLYIVRKNLQKYFDMKREE